jgi:predicted phage terminase large subunit-like protein
VSGAAALLRRELAEPIELRPQPGMQERFLATEADIAIAGGSAYSGKTFALLLEPLRHQDNGDFAAVCFRRDTTQVRNPGGLWDESAKLYQLYGAHPREAVLEHTFPSGALVKFAHLEHENSVLSWDGAQIPLLMFDQLEHFSRAQFFYMLSRNRDPSGTVRSYVRATCNPNADSWLAEFIAWWIDPATGYPIAERAGVLRWMMRLDESIVWADSREALVEQFGPSALVDSKSVTFVPGTIYDNRIGMARDPSYLGTLKALNRVERERLLGGNWKIRPAAGLLFQGAWCETVDALPADCDFVRGWDLAATKKTELNDPDWTVGLKLGRSRSTRVYYLCHAVRMRESPGPVKDSVRNVATGDGKACGVYIKQDPGQAGKAQFADFTTWLDGYRIDGTVVTGDKVTNFNPFSSQAEHGNVKILRGFSGECLASMEAFPEAKHDDDADAASAAYEGLQGFRGPMKISASLLARA